MSAPWWRTPGVHPEIGEIEYHSVCDPGSVTASMLRRITPPEFTPAHLRHYLDAEREEKSYFDFGSAYHTGVLGTGKTVVEVKLKSWQSDAAIAARKAAYAEGAVPLLTKELDVVKAMVAATLADAGCARLLTAFTPELVIVWFDEPTQLWCRAMIDFVPDYDVHMTLGEFKTIAGNADPGSVSAAIGKHRYDQPLAHSITGCRVLGLADTITPVLIACGKEPPHVPLCRPVDEETIRIGAVCNAKALDLYATCLATGKWPGYDDPEVEQPPLGLPGWKRYQFNTAFAEGVYDIEELW